MTTFACALFRIGQEAHGFLIELALQVLGIGRKPHRPLVLLRPDPGRREIAQRLAKARSRFGQQDVVEGGGFTRRKAVQWRLAA